MGRGSRQECDQGCVMAGWLKRRPDIGGRKVKAVVPWRQDTASSKVSRVSESLEIPCGNTDGDPKGKN